MTPKKIVLEFCLGSPPSTTRLIGHIPGFQNTLRSRYIVDISFVHFFRGVVDICAKLNIVIYVCGIVVLL